jgi:hypothetical protein
MEEASDSTAAMTSAEAKAPAEEAKEGTEEAEEAEEEAEGMGQDDEVRAKYDISIRAALFELISRKGEVLSCDGVPVNARNKGANSMRLWSDKGRLIAVRLEKDEALVACWLVPKGVTDPRSWIKLARYKGHRIKQWPVIVDLARNRDLVAVFDSDKHGVEVSPAFLCVPIVRGRDGVEWSAVRECEAPVPFAGLPGVLSPSAWARARQMQE